jgi:hypothetical protein
MARGSPGNYLIGDEDEALILAEAHNLPPSAHSQSQPRPLESTLHRLGPSRQVWLKDTKGSRHQRINRIETRSEAPAPHDMPLRSRRDGASYLAHVLDAQALPSGVAWVDHHHSPHLGPLLPPPPPNP